jgi:hypothetical protein
MNNAAIMVQVRPSMDSFMKLGNGTLVKADVILEYPGPRPRTLQAGQTVTLCEPVPFGWWDVFNQVLYKEESTAVAAKAGGNDIIPLYREVI